LLKNAKEKEGVHPSARGSVDLFICSAEARARIVARIFLFVFIGRASVALRREFRL
jgi:hypothetical protein